MIEGNCLCGAVSFQLNPERIALFNNCYCKSCQRDSGAGFVSQLQIPREYFQWLKGEECIQHFESSPKVYRAFCSKCGSRVPMSRQGELIPVPCGLLNDNISVSPEVNMHLGSKASWALVDEDIHCLQDQGSDEFWSTFIEERKGIR